MVALVGGSKGGRGLSENDRRASLQALESSIPTSSVTSHEPPDVRPMCYAATARGLV
jgi:hypothetical protein